jgi:CRISPR/Cas system CSM-associated protein Csm4 (group 5 of RAMP superfamily)
MLFELRMRPTGPWRTGERAGDRERVDAIYHSDALYSAVTHAMSALGYLDAWLDATARASEAPAVRFGSLFPFAGPLRLAPPPRTSWPPAAQSRLYLHAAKLVPLEVIFGGLDDDSRWMVDGASECLLPVGAAAPFTVSLRSAAAVDRLTGQTEPHRTACLEFAPDAGWWGLVEITGDDWEPRVRAALRLLADSGFGGERSRGWGRATDLELADATTLFGTETKSDAWWLLSLYSPHEGDAVDWSRGNYSTVTRAGWTASAAGSVKKKQVRMIEEGSVLMAAGLRGRAVDVAPEGFAHPAWRAGFALAVPAPTGAES